MVVALIPFTFLSPIPAKFTVSRVLGLAVEQRQKRSFSDIIVYVDHVTLRRSTSIITHLVLLGFCYQNGMT